MAAVGDVVCVCGTTWAIVALAAPPASSPLADFPLFVGWFLSIELVGSERGGDKDRNRDG